MNRAKIVLWMVVLIVLSPFSTEASEKTSPVKKPHKQEVKDVSVREVVKMLSTVNPIIIDLRTPREFNQGHLKGAKNINFYAANFLKKLKELDKNKPYLIYCAVGGRSSRTYSAMKQLGFKHIYHMKEGYSMWHSKNLPIVRKKKDLVRQ